MQLKNLRNKVHRDGFDLSRRVGFTAKVGELLPVDYVPCCPGDHHVIQLNTFTRTSPVQTASSARLREYFDVYFVPYRLLWRNFNDWVMQGNNSQIAMNYKMSAFSNGDSPFTTVADIKSVVESDAFSVPYETAQDDTTGTYSRRDCAIKLIKYLGIDYDKIGTPAYGAIERSKINIWNFLAYQKIYNDYFRYGQWEDNQPYTFNVDYISSEDDMNLYLAENDYTKIHSPFDLRFCNYDKDYFHGILPSPQFGDSAIASPIVGQINGSFSLGATPEGAGQGPILEYSPTSGSLRTQQGTVPFVKSNGGLQITDGSGAGLSVLSIRYAEMFQKWKEITLSSDDRSYKSLVQKHWNVNVSDYFSDKCQYLGGSSSTININEVINQNLAVDGSEADIAGKGTNNTQGRIEFDCKEYGVIMVMYHCKPLIEWELQDTFDKTYMQVRATDFPLPEFDNIGMEPVREFEFLDQSTDTVCGYAPRYVNYKTSFDKVKGDFTGSLRSWALPYKLRMSATGVNYLAFKVDPGIVNNLFAVSVDGNVDTDHLQVHAFLDIKSVRNLSTDGLPY